MVIIRGTTPTIMLTEFSVTGQKIYITFKQEDTVIEITNDRITEVNGVGQFTLTQEETLSLRSGAQCEVQARAIRDGIATASYIELATVHDVLKKGVIV